MGNGLSVSGRARGPVSCGNAGFPKPPSLTVQAGVSRARFCFHLSRRRATSPTLGGCTRCQETMPFFLEWERGGGAPCHDGGSAGSHLRYYSSRRPLTDHGALPVVLVIFNEDLAVTHFL